MAARERKLRCAPKTEAQRVRKKEDQRAVLLEMRRALVPSQETRAKKIPLLPLHRNLNRTESVEDLIQEMCFERENSAFYNVYVVPQMRVN